MKTVSFIAAFAVFGLVGAHAQGFKIGLNVGYPIGDVSDLYTVQLGVDVAYTWEVADSFTAGITTGYGNFLGADIDTGGGTVEVLSFSYVPIAATAAYGISESWFVGADIGYAVYAGKGEGKGGFLYQPEFGHQSENFEVYAFYKGISVESISVSSVGVGIGWKL